MDLEKRAETIAASMLGTNKVLHLDPKEFDQDLLDFAKEVEWKKINTLDDNFWLIRHFVVREIHFIQVQSPNKKIRYIVPMEDEKDGVKPRTFKEFLSVRESIIARLTALT